MVRTLGGCIGLAICSAVSRNKVSSGLSSFLSASQLAAISEDATVALKALPMSEQRHVRTVYGRAFNEQCHVLIAFAGLCGLASVGLICARMRSNTRKREKGDVKGKRREVQSTGEGTMTTATTADNTDSSHAAATAATMEEEEEGEKEDGEKEEGEREEEEKEEEKMQV